VILIAGNACLGGAAGPGAPERASRYRVEYATYFGGSEWEQPREIIPLADGSAVIGGQTSSSDLPVTEGAPQAKYAGEPPGTGHGGIYGGDCFLAKLDPTAGRIVFCTFWGGSRQERATYGFDVDSAGNLVVATACRSHDAPTTKGSYQPKYGGGRSDVLLGKLAADGRRFLWCTYFGGSGRDLIRGLAVTKSGEIYLAGNTDSDDLPFIRRGALQPKRKGGHDGIIIKLAPVR